MKIEIEIHISPTDYPAHPNAALARILQAVAEQVIAGKRKGFMNDIKKQQTVGRWQITE